MKSKLQQRISWDRVWVMIAVLALVVAAVIVVAHAASTAVSNSVSKISGDAEPVPAVKFTSLHTFAGPTADGSSPFAGLIQGASGNLYGTTEGGGANGGGTVFEITPAGKETVLYSFCAQTSCADGEKPLGSLIQDSSGNFYGTTTAGTTYGYGAVFELTTADKAIVLWTFTGGADGGHPVGGLVRDSKGNLYGTTEQGGTDGYGTVFEVSAGSEKVLHNFTDGADGGEPVAGLILGSNGYLYGTTYYGGKTDDGTVFEVTPAGKETVLHSFANDPDGQGPYAALIQDTKGNLYGTTLGGGRWSYGTLFEVTAAGKETVLYSFCSLSGCPDGATPYTTLVRDAKGNFYGTTSGGGDGWGIIFEVTAAGKENTLYNFTGGADGANPTAGLVSDGKGNGYGTTDGGGNAFGNEGDGTVFKISK
jgi:uncharacterized repeat protein (TIGR03803 family)